MKVAFCLDSELCLNNRILKDHEFAKAIASAHGPHLYQKLTSLGFQTVTGDVALNKINNNEWKSEEVIVIQNLNSKYAKNIIDKGGIPFLLILDESPLIIFHFYDKVYKFINQFHHFFSFSGLSKIISKKTKILPNFHHFYVVSYDANDFKQLIKDEEIDNWKNRKFINLIAGNKHYNYNFLSFKNLNKGLLQHFKHAFLHIFYRNFFSDTWKEINNNELRNPRLDAVLFFVKKNLIDIYGQGWEDLSNLPSKYRILGEKPYSECIKGRLKSVNKQNTDTLNLIAAHGNVAKFDILKKYKFTLCYENLALEGYITERIIHCFFTGSIPIYLGAPNIQDYIPSDLFIDANKFNNFDDLYNYLDNLEEIHAKNYIYKARNWLLNQRDNEMKFSSEYLSNKYADLINKNYRNKDY